MAEACYTVQVTTNQQVLNGIGKLTLQTNKNGQYTHVAILLLEKGIRRVLQSQFNPSNLGKGIEKLLNTGDNQLTLVLSTNAIMAGSVIKEAKLHAKAHLTLIGKTVLPAITAQAEAQERGWSEHHQSGCHWRKRGCCRRRHKTSQQGHHQRHPTHTQWQQPQGR